ncbi:MAG: DNA-3-methyladenine glycosylase 2 family protein [Alphaproteobacteria bacterium]|nr:DNA-3-methyladenine glycosylase 2 family protein [Alphaproteobacteria bacterium]
MHLEPVACYRALLARDARYDGRFFTCVKTTGVYCRPICPARPPKIENCVFVPSAAAAQKAGFRPCLRCRPESAPDLGAWRGTSATVSRALALIESGALDASGVETLAGRLGLGGRQLRRLFRQHLGAAPVTVAQTRRVLLAKQLIHQTNLSLTEIALASGFGSVRRFNETFRQLYNRPPGELRRAKGLAAPAAEAAITLLLPYRAPYDWEATMGFFRTRAIPGVETVAADRYRRIIQIGETIGRIEVTHRPAQTALRTTVHFPRLDALPVIIARIRRLFDLAADPVAIAAALSRDPLLAPLLAARPGLRVPGGWDGFEIAVRAVLGQQITLAAARRLAGKIAASFGDPVPGGAAVAGLTHAFARPERVDADGVAMLGMPRARAAGIAGLARAVCRDPGLFDPRQDLASAIARFIELPGVGEWTAQYIAMRGLNENDAFPAADIGLMRAYAAATGRRPTARELLERAESWRPWRAYAAVHLWTADATQGFPQAA